MPANPLELALRYALGNLGDTADAVAASLRADGITGRPRDCARCPLAVWVARRDFRTVVVSSNFIAACHAADLGRPVAVDIDELPNRRALAHFLARVDRDEYPDLTAPRTFTDIDQEVSE